jgi:hypothetical protein
LPLLSSTHSPFNAKAIVVEEAKAIKEITKVIKNFFKRLKTSDYNT